ncbi:MAG: cyclase family protein [Acidobacteriia bacterium]|nr:cyclase family protein [Terriglobia bacterium]
MIGWTMALAVLWIAHPKPPAGDRDVGTAVVELTYASSPRRAAAGHSPESVSIAHPQRIVAPLVVLDVTEHTRSELNYLVTLDDVAQWEEAHGHVPANAVMMARSDTRTGWRTHPDPSHRASNAGHFPGFSEDAIRFLVEARYAYGLGTETPDRGRSVVLVYRGGK